MAIATLTGENGILTQAQNAKEQNEIANAKEQARLDIMAWVTNELANGRTGGLTDAQVKSIITGKTYVKEVGETSFTTKSGYEIPYSELYTSTPGTEEPEGTEQAVVGQIVTGENKPYTKNGTAVIPVGFAIVPGLDDVSEGLVISDVANDTTDAGNQFVWIPVNNTNPFQIRAGYSNGSLQDISSYGEADSTGANSKVTETATTQAEAIAMYKSVSDNGGFYIGRYEAGVEGVELTQAGSSISGFEIRGEVVCKKGAYVYNSIKWGNSMTDETGGAVEVARNFAEENNYDTTKVHSTLCYGVQWDTALNFIDPGYTGYAKDSSKMGWYYDNYNSTSTGNIESNPELITGKDLIYNSEVTVSGSGETAVIIPAGEPTNMHKNIYDMAGNVYEWTMESYDTDKRANRGGHYYVSGTSYTTSGRYSYGPSNANSDGGFRLALYL